MKREVKCHARSVASRIALLAMMSVSANAVADGTDKIRLAGHAFHAENAIDLGRMGPNETMTLSVRLKTPHPEALDSFLVGLYTPGSANYRKFLTPDAFAAAYGPAPKDKQAVSDYLSANGFVAQPGNGPFVSARASISTVESAFQIEMHRYLVPEGSNGANSYVAIGATDDPLFPASLPVAAIHGLKTRHVRPHLKLTQQTAICPQYAGGAPDSSGLAPSDIRAAYGFGNIAETGAGQTIALVEYDGFTSSDITTYASQFGIATANIQAVSVDGASTAAPVLSEQNEGPVEVTLDIDMLLAAAPGAKIMVYEGLDDTDAEYTDVLQQIATDDKAQVVSSSWGAPEDDPKNGADTTVMETENAILQQMAAQGQTFFSAAGDSGAFDDPGYATTPWVDDPAVQPYATGVGGTTLKLSASAGYVSESTWNDLSSDEGGGGGGVSRYYSTPSWQAGYGTTANLGSQTMRMVPDVSLNADPNSGYGIYMAAAASIKSSTLWFGVGGTSAAAPLWAGFTALVNEKRASSSMSAIGYLNPSLYQVGQSSIGSAAFHDVADGSTNGHFPAVTGYDMATGWGSINSSLFQALTSSVLPPLPPTGFSASP